MEKVFTKPSWIVVRLRQTLLLLAILLAGQFTASGQSTNPAPYCGNTFFSFNSTCDGWAAAFEKVEFNKLNFSGPACPSANRSSGYSYWDKASFPQYTTSVVKGPRTIFLLPHHQVLLLLTSLVLLLIGMAIWILMMLMSK